MDYLIMAGQLILSLSILIVLHEMGHFIPARLFGTRVEKFYLFFDPWFALYKKKIGETEYGIGWLPLGGYVKISGMIDESFDREQMAQEPKDYEFRSKPAWQRLIIMLGGVTVNFLLGFLIFGMVLWVWGEEYLPAENAKFGIAVDSLGMDLGLRDGDFVLAVGDRDFEVFNDRILLQEIVINDAKTIDVRRNGQEQTLPVEDRFVKILSSRDNQGKSLFVPRYPFVAREIAKDSPAEKAGVQPMDSIIALNDIPTPYFVDFLRLARERKGEEIKVTLFRPGSNQNMDLNITTTDAGKIGVGPFGVDRYFALEKKEYTLGEALPAGTLMGWNLLATQVKAFGQMFRGKISAKDNLGGFGTIGSMFGAQWQWERFWRITAILSLVLAFMNLLPIPALDGGHVMFLLYEVASGRKPSDKFMEYATIVGFVIVLGLVLYANGMDIIRNLF